MGKSQAVSNAGITAILRNACKCCLVIFKRPNYILKFCKRIFNPLQCTILPEFPAARNPSRKREIQQFCRARGFFISGFTGFRFFAVRFRSPGDVQIPTAQTHAPFGAQSAPCLPNILRSAAERRPLMEEIFSLPRFRGIKGRLSSRIFRAACANMKIFSARAEYILWADKRRRPEILSRNCIRAGPLSILCRLSAPRTI